MEAQLNNSIGEQLVGNPRCDKCGDRHGFSFDCQVARAIFPAKNKPAPALAPSNGESDGNIAGVTIQSDVTIDFNELDRLRERSDAALVWLQEREPMCCTLFKDAADARSARAVYYEHLRRVAPELIRLARIGSLSLQATSEDGSNGN